MCASRDRGLRAGRDALQLGNHTRNFPLQGLDLGGDVDLREQAAEVPRRRVDEARIDVREHDLAHVAAGAARDPGLDCAVPVVLVLDRGGRLDLDQRVAAASALERIDTHAHATVCERRLEQAWRFADRSCQQRVRFGQRLVRMQVIGFDQHAAAEQVARQLAKARALVEHRLRRGAPLRGLASVQLQPQAPVALATGLDAGFGQSGCCADACHGVASSNLGGSLCADGDSSCRIAATHAISPAARDRGSRRSPRPDDRASDRSRPGRRPSGCWRRREPARG